MLFLLASKGNIAQQIIYCGLPPNMEQYSVLKKGFIGKIILTTKTNNYYIDSATYISTKDSVFQYFNDTLKLNVIDLFADDELYNLVQTKNYSESKSEIEKSYIKLDTFHIYDNDTFHETISYWPKTNSLICYQEQKRKPYFYYTLIEFDHKYLEKKRILYRLNAKLKNDRFLLNNIKTKLPFNEEIFNYKMINDEKVVIKICKYWCFGNSAKKRKLNYINEFEYYVNGLVKSCKYKSFVRKTNSVTSYSYSPN